MFVEPGKAKPARFTYEKRRAFTGISCEQTYPVDQETLSTLEACAPRKARCVYSVCREAFPQPNTDEISHLHGLAGLTRLFNAMFPEQK